MAHSSRKITLSGCKRLFGESAHIEPSRSEAAEAYVWKEETRIQGTQFELGKKPFHRNRDTDWQTVLDAAKRGNFDIIPPDVQVRCYNQLKRIAADHLQPVAIQRQVAVFWGRTGTGKSRRAWEEAGIDAYPKDPNTKFWCGYRGKFHSIQLSHSNLLDHLHVVIDEFRGGIAINHLLRWFDRYPVIVEIKGGAVVLKATSIWITSNISPDEWFPDLDDETKAALRRRLRVTHFN